MMISDVEMLISDVRTFQAENERLRAALARFLDLGGKCAYSWQESDPFTCEGIKARNEWCRYCQARAAMAGADAPEPTEAKVP